MKGAVLRLGLLYGGVLAIYVLINYLTNNQFADNMALGIVVFLLNVVFAVFAIQKRKQELNNTLSYGQGVWASVLVSAIGGFVYAVAFYLIYFVVDAEAFKVLNEAIISKTLENIDVDAFTEEQLDSVLSYTKIMFSLGPLLGVLGNALVGLIVGLIASAFMKREPDIFETTAE